jgi:hypothetical protein
MSAFQSCLSRAGCALAIAALGLAAPTVAGAAPETFTFTSANKSIDGVQLPAATQGGRPTGAGVFSIATKTTYADGKVTQFAGKCSNWILPPGSQFGSDSVCVYADASGPLYTVQFTCEVPGPGSNCWGKLIGTGGAFKGRTGTFTSGGTGQGTSIGAGLWN